MNDWRSRLFSVIKSWRINRMAPPNYFCAEEGKIYLIILLVKIWWIIWYIGYLTAENHRAILLKKKQKKQTKHGFYRVYEQTPAITLALLWRHDGRDGVSHQQTPDCLLNRPFQRRSEKTSKFRVTGLCDGNSPMTGEFPAQRANSAEKLHLMTSSWKILAVISMHSSPPKTHCFCIPP